MKSIFYPVFLILIFISCSKKDVCPADVILGSLSLMDNSRDFLPYQGIRFLEYITVDTFEAVNPSNPDTLIQDIDTLYSPASLIHDSSRTVIANICFDLENDERSDTFYLSEHKTVNYFDLDTSRKFRIIGNLGINEDFLSKESTVANPVLYDELKLTVHRSNPSISGAVASIEFVANDRGNKDRMSDSLKSRINKFVLKSQITIDKYTYDDVYEYRNNDSLYFYFKPLVGVVAFRDINNRWWNLLRAY